MTHKIDIETLKRQTDILTVVERHITLKKRGTEWFGICPFHDDHTTSLQVNERKQIFKCFACGTGGDSIDFLTKLGHTFPEAIAEISGQKVTSSGNVHRVTLGMRPKRVEWKQILPDECTGEISHYRHGIPSRSWIYRTETGEPIGYICRFDLPDGVKEVLPYIYATDGTRSEWRWQGFDKPRPLYNLNQLASRPDATVMIVEGEKTADAAQALFPRSVVTTWQGGARAIQHTNWAPLAGRTVVLWSDHDRPGEVAMWDIADLIQGIASKVKWVHNPADAPKHWDLADADWTPEHALAYARENMTDVPPRVEAEPEPTPAPEPEPDPIQEQEPDQAPEHDPEPPYFAGPDHLPPNEYEPDTEELPFRLLGYTKDGDNTRHHFFSKLSQTVISLGPSNMSINNLMQLAPLQYWEMHFQGRKGFSINSAVNWITANSTRVGYFSDSNIRGRGAWQDGTHTVIHAGNRLIVDGKPVELRKYDSKYVYEAGEELPFHTYDPLSTEEANRLMDLSRLLNWEREISAYLLIGWCIVAPICGSLKWRPHIWLTGAAGTGKSWVFRSIVRRLMEGIALAVQSETSEAGLRQTLGHDALPVVFDEAEGEDKRAQERMQSVLGLMRSASSEDGGSISKGSAGGSAVSYRIRSCFAFASISVQVAQQSDRTRVTILGLRKNDTPEGAERWKTLQHKYHELMTDEYVRRLKARTVALMPVILANTRTFASAAATVIGEQRAGDQLGAMLAGAYSLYSTKEISLDAAIEWLKSRDWSEEKSLDKTRDEVSLLAHLMDQMTRVEATQMTVERNIGELVAIATGVSTDILLPDMAHSRLKRIGFKIEGEFLAISNTADWVKKAVTGTAWAKNHNKILLRIDGATNLETTRFGSGLQTRAVGVPLAVILEGYMKPAPPVEEFAPW